MSKVKKISFVGYQILKQIFKLIDTLKIQGLINKHQGDYYYKAFKTKAHLLTMLFAILSRCDYKTETCEGLRALGGKLNHLGLQRAHANSMASDALRNRDHSIFEDLYFALVERYKTNYTQEWCTLFAASLLTVNKRMVEI